jgi:hypothetical protein
MKFAKIAAALFGVANAGVMGGIGGATTTHVAGHSAKKVTEKVHCGQYPHFVPKYRDQHRQVEYNGYAKNKIHPHGAIAQDLESTSYIPAETYYNNKWCVTLDLKLSMK